MNEISEQFDDVPLDSARVDVHLAVAHAEGKIHSELSASPVVATATTELDAPEDHIALKWGTLKSWRLHSEKGRELLSKYHARGSSWGAITQRDTAEQKELICQMIDECNAPTIFLDWDGIDVSKEEAKKYVREYGIKAAT